MQDELEKQLSIQNDKPTHKKYTLKKTHKRTLQAVFFKRVFFSATQVEFLPTLLFLIKLFSPTHKLSANLTRHSFECKSLLTSFRADIDRQFFVAKGKPAANRVNGLTGFFTVDVRLSHLSAEM